jgi:ketopantoate hydroxymethyltransferase
MRTATFLSTFLTSVYLAERLREKEKKPFVILTLILFVTVFTAVDSLTAGLAIFLSIDYTAVTIPYTDITTIQNTLTASAILLMTVIGLIPPTTSYVIIKMLNKTKRGLK